MIANNPIWKYLRYIFYRGYLWQQRNRQDENTIARRALGYVTVFLGLYTIAAGAALQVLFGIPFLTASDAADVMFAAICVVLFFFIPDYLFLRGGRYKKILEEFTSKHETAWQLRIRGAIIFFNYIFAFILTIALAVLAQK